jgi:hypothetical protein
MSNEKDGNFCFLVPNQLLWKGEEGREGKEEREKEVEGRDERKGVEKGKGRKDEGTDLLLLGR